MIDPIEHKVQIEQLGTSGPDNSIQLDKFAQQDLTCAGAGLTNADTECLIVAWAEAGRAILRRRKQRV